MTAKHKLEDLLNFSLENIPDSSYLPYSASDNCTGHAVIKFGKKADPKIYDLFNNIEINTFLEVDKKNIILSSVDFGQASIPSLELLVENLFNIYGEDAIGSKQLKEFDLEQIKSGYWPGRLWSDHQKYEIPILLAFDKEEGLSLTIFYSK